jgi:hypothetical protein
VFVPAQAPAPDTLNRATFKFAEAEQPVEGSFMTGK